MALVPIRSDMYAPTRGKNFATLTAAVLHTEVALGGAAPANINHLPCGVIADTAAAFTWKDVAGNTITTNLAAGVFTPISPAEITGASVAAVTIFWMPEP